jgi:hypothetical protein
MTVPPIPPNSHRDTGPLARVGSPDSELLEATEVAQDLEPRDFFAELGEARDEVHAQYVKLLRNARHYLSSGRDPREVLDYVLSHLERLPDPELVEAPVVLQCSDCFTYTDRHLPGCSNSTTLKCQARTAGRSLCGANLQPGVPCPFLGEHL